VADTDGNRPDGSSARSNGETSEHRPTLLGQIAGRLGHFLRALTGSGSVREDLEEILKEEEGAPTELAPQERHMLRNILQFGDLRVGDVMVPRADIIGVEEGMKLEELVQLFSDAQHSRLPVYRQTLDSPIGMVHVKDVIGLLVPGREAPKDFDLRKFKRDVLFVPATMPVVDLLMKMQQRHIHLALVIDEYGGTEGLVSIEDLVEQIVGDIADEHDTDAPPMLLQRADGTFDADARVMIEDFETRANLRLVEPGDEEDIETLGGLVTSLAGRVPKRGEVIDHDAVSFEVVDADARRIKRLRLRLVTPPAEPSNDLIERDETPPQPKARVGGG
jgi:CBS domain containing-hemolysin-like protein